MHVSLLALRLVHIVCGVFWAGTALFTVLWLEPSVRAAGPAGGQVMQRLVERRYALAMPVTALLTVISGIALFLRLAAGDVRGLLHSSVGASFALGGSAAIISFFIGVLVIGPAGMQSIRAMGEAAQASDEAARQRHLATAGALRDRMAIAARTAASLVTVALVMMSVARYL